MPGVEMSATRESAGRARTTTKAELYAEAKKRHIAGRSSMTKAQLQRAKRGSNSRKRDYSAMSQADLMVLARQLDGPGRATMSRADLEKAVDRLAG